MAEPAGHAPSQPEQTVTLPTADWQTITAALYELPAKFAVPVIQRLQAELRKPDADDDGTTVTPFRGTD